MILLQVKESAAALDRVFEVSILAGVLFLLLLGLAWFAYKQDNRIFSIVESNTKANQELTKAINELKNTVVVANKDAVNDIVIVTKESFANTKISMLETMAKYHEELKRK